MAEIIAGVTMSHVPAIGAALDNGKTAEPYWAPLFKGFEPSKKWMAETKPDACFVVFNDHGCAISPDIVPTFALGCAVEFPPADEGFGPRPVPMVKGDPEFAAHIGQEVILEGFDLTLMNTMAVDHGLTVPLSLMFGQPAAWPCPIIPLAVNVTQYPYPTGARCYALGKAIRKAVRSFEKDLRVVIFGTGGMSHQIHGQRAGLINSDFDKIYLDRMSADPDALARMAHIDYMREAGAESVELIMWLVMRGALDARVEEVYRFYHVAASNTAVGHLILANT